MNIVKTNQHDENQNNKSFEDNFSARTPNNNNNNSIMDQSMDIMIQQNQNQQLNISPLRGIRNQQSQGNQQSLMSQNANVTTVHQEGEDFSYQQENPYFQNQYPNQSQLPALNCRDGKTNQNGCRICLDDLEDDENPFITPCKCAGSMKFIHLKCLREWLDSKRISQKLPGVYSYYWEELSCELCKEPLCLNNVSLKGDNRIYYLLNFKQPKNKRYMVLESDIECLSKAIHVIILDKKKEFTVGRRINNDITVSDISVSRQQASFSVKDDKLFLEDCDSKFGTFVKINGPIKVQKHQILPLQIEKKCLFIKLESRFTCFQQCFIGFGFSKQLEQYDHYIDVKNKFPEDLENYFFPQPIEIQNHPMLKRKSYNRVLDESIITQLTVMGVNTGQTSAQNIFMNEQDKKKQKEDKEFRQKLPRSRAQISSLQNSNYSQQMTHQSPFNRLVQRRNFNNEINPLAQHDTNNGNVNEFTSSTALQIQSNVIEVGSRNIEQQDITVYNPQFNSFISNRQNDESRISRISVLSLAQEMPQSFRRAIKDECNELGSCIIEEDKQDEKIQNMSIEEQIRQLNNDSDIEEEVKLQDSDSLSEQNPFKFNRKSKQIVKREEVVDQLSNTSPQHNQQYDLSDEESKSQQFNKVMILKQGKAQSLENTFNNRQLKQQIDFDVNEESQQDKIHETINSFKERNNVLIKSNDVQIPDKGFLLTLGKENLDQSSHYNNDKSQKAQSINKLQQSFESLRKSNSDSSKN